MTHKTPTSRHAIGAFSFQLHKWNPFHLRTLTKALDSSHTSKRCFSNRSLDNLDLSRLSLFDEDRRPKPKREHFRWIARKRRRRGSRSVSGRSSDKSGTLRCCSVGPSAAYATCSDFPVAVGTDSSGELFLNGEVNWALDVGEAKREGRGSAVERENSTNGALQLRGFDGDGNESGYGSEPGYRGDGEFGYGDEGDEEEDDGRTLFWGDEHEGGDAMELAMENTYAEQKAHHRCRRRGMIRDRCFH